MIFAAKGKYGNKVRLLGEGVSGRVDLFVRKNEKFAVKTYKGKETYESPKEYRQRVSNEFEILHGLSHKNIVRVIDLLSSRKMRLIMEFCPVSVRDMLNDENKLNYFKQLVQGVHFLQSMEICHRDIKMDNLMIDVNGDLKIIDFADAVKGRKESIGIVGTGPYVAPEVYGQFRYDGFKSDMWSVGIVLYYFIHYELPWKIAKQHEDTKFQEFVNQGLGDRSYVELGPVLQKLLTVDPVKRMSVNELLSYIETH